MLKIVFDTYKLFNRSAGRGQLRVDPDDIIFPAHFFDQVSTLRELILGYTFRYNDVLDPKKLHDSLIELLEVDDWRKLGGRLRLDVRH